MNNSYSEKPKGLNNIPIVVVVIMTSEKVLKYIDEELGGLDYDDFSNVDAMIEKVIDKQAALDVGREAQFSGALRGGIKQYFKDAEKIFDEINTSKIPTDLPRVDIIHRVFQRPLEQGIQRKLPEIQLRESIRTADTIQQLEEITIPPNVSNRLSLQITKGIKLAKERVFAVTGKEIPKSEIWSRANQIAEDAANQASNAQTIIELNRIDLSRIPTRRGRKIVKRAIRARKRQLA